MIDINKYTNKLLELSGNISKEMGFLMDLTAANREETNNFSLHIKRLNSYLDSEAIILNTIKKEELLKIFKNLSTINQNNDAYNRCYMVIDDMIEDLLNSEDTLIEETDNEDTNNEFSENISNEELDKQTDIINILDDYYLPEDGICQYVSYVIHRNAIIAIKKMLDRITSTRADNLTEMKYKKKLIDNFKMFKYYFFTIDRECEKLGVIYKFNTNNVPYLKNLSIDLSIIQYNECVSILDKLYAIRSTINVDDISEALFDTICFEEYIANLDNSYIDQLISLCEHLKTFFPDNRYGDIGHKKLIKKKEESN